MHLTTTNTSDSISTTTTNAILPMSFSAHRLLTSTCVVRSSACATFDIVAPRAFTDPIKQPVSLQAVLADKTLLWATPQMLRVRAATAKALTSIFAGFVFTTTSFTNIICFAALVAGFSRVLIRHSPVG